MIRSAIRWTVKQLARKAPTRRWFNIGYNLLLPALLLRRRYFWGFCDLFEQTESLEPSLWVHRFADRKIFLPVVTGLDWDVALSMTGFEREVKPFYARVIKHTPPNLFIDIGANFGTHSLLFLAHGIRTISVEPNPLCHDWFKQVCALNGFSPRLEPVALSDREGMTELRFPERDTWWGQIAEADETNDWRHNTICIDVPVRTLDSYYDKLDEACGFILIKIDAEHSERRILLGAERVLRDLRPIVVFESISTTEREAVHAIFTSMGYKIAGLPNCKLISDVEFKSSLDLNFVALNAKWTHPSLMLSATRSGAALRSPEPGRHGYIPMRTRALVIVHALKAYAPTQCARSANVSVEVVGIDGR